MRQIPWNPFEVAFLIYHYSLIESGSILKKDAVRDISRRLRAHAIKEGIHVDDTFRNENGISMRLEELRYLLTNGDKGIMNTSALFRTMVGLYQTNNDRYQEILRIAMNLYMPMTESTSTAEETTITSTNDPRFQSCDEIQNEKTDRVQMEIPIVVFDWEQHTIPPSIIPVCCTYFGTALSFRCSWEGLYASLVEALYSDYPAIMDSLRNVVPIVTGGLYLANQSGITKMVKPKKINNDLFLEIHCTPSRIVSNLRLLLNMCLVDLENVVIYYQTDPKKAPTKSFSPPPEIKPQSIMSASPDQPEPAPAQNQPAASFEEKTTDSPMKHGIISILKNHFQYGFKPDSVRDLMRFRMFADEETIALPESDEDLKEAIAAVSTLVEGKRFAQSDEVTEQLQRIVTDIFANGTIVIYYEALLEQHSEWMHKHHINSESMLKEMLQKQFPESAFAKRFMMNEPLQTEYEAVSAEIVRTWGDKSVKSVDSISTDLPYILTKGIWRAISRSPHFARVSDGMYFLTDRLVISEDECEEILNYVERACSDNGYASLGDLPLESVEEQNYEIPPLTIQAAVYSKLLSERFTLNGRILTRDNAELSAVILLKQYLVEKESCSFDELDAKNMELTGAPNRKNVFQALFDCMVRIDENMFVAPHLVEFPIDEIDRVLAGFITDHFCALKDITTFALFPLCGQTWNHYLLESYCYKYSRRFSLHVINFNNKNAGVIAEKDYGKNYIDMLALVLSKADIELTPDIIGPYLFQNGYLAKSKYGRLDEIAAKAKALRKDS